LQVDVGPADQRAGDAVAPVAAPRIHQHGAEDRIVIAKGLRGIDDL
jgi:hypothetical protein